MTGLKAVLSFIGTIILVAFGAFGFGRMKGREKAEYEAEKQRINENAAAVKATAERRIEVTKEVGNVQQSVNHMADDDLDRELRESWKRPGGG